MQPATVRKGSITCVSPQNLCSSSFSSCDRSSQAGVVFGCEIELCGIHMTKRQNFTDPPYQRASVAFTMPEHQSFVSLSSPAFIKDTKAKKLPQITARNRRCTCKIRYRQMSILIQRFGCEMLQRVNLTPPCALSPYLRWNKIGRLLRAVSH